ncbi:TIGR02757 family protein [Reichenbachiella carrageenanivorans]|uniref:TIGR02757 family protein n=1 Tax=Reichenbachiella carrageenanivorans TaxID=2979869 RepID=A0ABY6CW36_9BACT|nr:TIGR02757 family protein [Reichenbachiella carrageenanivorans]UXX78117.1 TIGR02757 family protein [Reichenbachiella carrageenanivorans]
MNKLKDFLDEQVAKYNQPDFIPEDPISIPHLFTKKQDIEIAGLFAAILAWGQRKTIINKCQSLIEMMDHAPHDFIINHQEEDLKRFLSFKHRTFNATDTLFFIAILKAHYQKHDSLETAFTLGKSGNMETFLINFHNTCFAHPDAPDRTRKHIATPARKSACKRLNMYLRWMVRKDNKGVDFGLWQGITPNQLICPLDVHVERVAKRLGLLHRKPSDWLAAQELTTHLRELDPIDPVKYDFALFGLGVMEKF